MIPPLDDRGLLPFGRHITTLDEIRQRFTNNTHRTRLWKNFNFWLEEMKSTVRIRSLWLSGSFFTSKPEPNDIDVLAWIPLRQMNTALPKLSSLLTHQNVISNLTIAQGAFIERIQPASGRVDGFFAQDGQKEAEKVWDEIWSGIFDTDNNRIGEKGYLEVRL